MTDGFKDISRRRNPADKVIEDFLIEILSRLPYKSLCRFNCVSKRWRGIISHPDHRKALPQYHLDDLAGFLYPSRGPDTDDLLTHNFIPVSVGGRPPIDPSLAFLPACDRFNLLDSCNGLLLCGRFKTADSRAFDYVVCNPATEKWVALPGFFSKMHTARLGFDPAVSSYFHVFQFLADGAVDTDGYVDDDEEDSDGFVKGVEIYSSETGAWSHKDSGWGFYSIVSHSRTAFVNGSLHLLAVQSAVLAVDVEGTTWRVIPIPYHPDHPIDLGFGVTDLSQGHLYLAHTDQHDKCKLSIWVLKDYDSQVWVLKHSIRYFHLFVDYEYAHLGSNYHIAALHPQGNMIFLVYHKTLMFYQMDSRKLKYIDELGPDSMDANLPYFPLYSEALADWH